MPEAPAPTVLQPQSDEGESPAPEQTPVAPTDKKQGQSDSKKPRRFTYRPNHRATFIGLGVVVVVLIINAGVVFYLMRQNTNEEPVQREQVTISTDQLEKLGVNRSSVGDLGTELVVGPDSRFNGKVTVGSDVDIAGQLTLNNKVSAADASLTKLQAGDTSLNNLNVNGTILTNDLDVVGATRLQGNVTASSNMTIVGNLTVGGAIFAGVFQANSLISGSTLTIGGHIVVKAAPPTVSSGSAVGSNGTVSISGNDATGTVAVNVGTGASAGVLANINFHDKYDTTPHVVVTAVGRSAGDFYVNRTTTGFSILVTSGLSTGGYAFDYVIVQ